MDGAVPAPPAAARPLRCVRLVPWGIALYAASLALPILPRGWWTTDPPDFPWLVRLGFLAGIWVALIPFAVRLPHEQDKPLPLLRLIALFYIALFAVPPFYVDRAWFWYLTDITGDLALLVSGGIAAFFAGFYLVTPPWHRLRPALPFPRHEDTRHLRVLALVLCLAHLLFLYYPALRAVPSFSQLATPLGLLGYGIALLLFIRGSLSRMETVLIFGVLLLLKIVWHVLFGLFTDFILLLLYLVALKPSLDRRRLLAITLPAFLAFTAIVALRPFIDFYRIPLIHQAKHQTEPQQEAITLESLAERAGGLSTTLTEVMAQKSRWEVYLRNGLSRMSLQFATLSHAVDRTPATIPYWEGHTMKNLLANNIPRVFWSEKPQEHIGQEFGKRYGIVMPEDNVTSWNLPWLTEFYINFGMPGVLFGMFLAGGLLALLDGLLNIPNIGITGTALGTSILFPLFYQESNLSLKLGNVAVLFLTLLVICHCVMALGRRRASAARVSPCR